MTSREPHLRDAVEALRALGDGDAPSPDTRARVLGTLARKRKSARALSAVGVALAICLTGTAALGWHAGWLPAAWRTLRDQPETRLELPATPGPEREPKRAAMRAAGSREVTAELPAESRDIEAELPAVVEAPAELPAPAPVLPAPEVRRAPAIRSSAHRTGSEAASAEPAPRRDPVSPAPVSPAPPEEPAVAASDAELGDYRAAHARHFDDRDAAGALVAWDQYLARWPDGRFAVEARYNRALALVRLGRMDEAVTALRPFAEGATGGYRRDEARRLLRALSR